MLGALGRTLWKIREKLSLRVRPWNSCEWHNICRKWQLMCRVTVNCRIGSLESNNRYDTKLYYVNCRIGSLEILWLKLSAMLVVNCRIGSLEVLFSVILMQARYSVSNSCNKSQLFQWDNWLKWELRLSAYSSVIPITRHYNQIVLM